MKFFHTTNNKKYHDDNAIVPKEEALKDSKLANDLKARSQTSHELGLPNLRNQFDELAQKISKIQTDQKTILSSRIQQ